MLQKRLCCKHIYISTLVSVRDLIDFASCIKLSNFKLYFLFHYYYVECTVRITQDKDRNKFASNRTLRTCFNSSCFVWVPYHVNNRILSSSYLWAVVYFFFRKFMRWLFRSTCLFPHNHKWNVFHALKKF